jgi:hypothetical protein
MNGTTVSKGIPRRDFLRISSAAAIGVVVVVASDGTLFASTSSGIVPLMDVGFAASLPPAGYSVPLGSADSILSPDPHFISSGARVSMVGAKRAASHKNAPGGIGVDALYMVSHRQPEDPAHFRFFSVVGQAGDDAMSGRISFTMLVPSTTGVAFMIKRQRPSAAKMAASATPPPMESETSPLTLSLGNVAGPKLTRGVYALAFREEDGDSMPSWNRLAIAPSNGDYIIPGATFSYLLLNVDYADAEKAPERPGAAPLPK